MTKADNAYQELLKSGYESIVLQSMTDKELIELWKEVKEAQQ